MVTKSEQTLKERYKWNRIHAPRSWQPQAPGEELVGYYGGRTLRNGSFGQYEVALVHVPRGGTRMVSGVAIIQLLDSAFIDKGHPIRIVYKGTQPTTAGHDMKLFDLLVAEGEPVALEDLPEVQQ